MGNPKRHEGCWDSETFKSILDKSEINYGDLAKVLDISVPSINSYANNRAIPGLPAAIKMADYFGVPLDVFCGRLSEEELQTVMQDFKANFMLLRRHDYETAFLNRKDIPYKYERDHLKSYAEAPYPYNLLDDVVTGPGYANSNKKYWSDWLMPDQEAALRYVLSTLGERERKIIQLYYGEGYTLEETGKEFELTRERVRQILARAVRKMRHPTRLKMIEYGLEGYEHVRANQKRRELLRMEDEELDALEQELIQRRQFLESALEDVLPIDEEKRMSCVTTLEDMDLSVRTFNCLRRANCLTLYDVVEATKDGKLVEVRNLGKKSLNEVLCKVKDMTGVDYGYVYAKEAG